jgi:hypothetical protein
VADNQVPAYGARLLLGGEEEPHPGSVAKGDVAQVEDDLLDAGIQQLQRAPGSTR